MTGWRCGAPSRTGDEATRRATRCAARGPAVIAVRLGEIAVAVQGRLVGADPDTFVSAAVEFDSRRIRPGGLFVALPGEHVDGHAFTAAAAAAGGVAAIVTRPVPGAHIVVDDALLALGRLAAMVIRRLTQVTVIGITGSSGKTSTKDLLAQVLAPLGPTVAPPGSFNNELGHPYTVLLAATDTRFLVLETSARGVGHIRYLTQVAPPRIGVVLNVGSAHVGEFGSREAIALAKGELVESLPAAADGGVAILNGDDRAVRAMAVRTRARVLFTGTAPGSDILADAIELDRLGRARYRLVVGAASAPVTLLVSGQHQVANSLAAAAAALECGMSLDQVAAGLSRAQAQSRWRMAVTERPDGVVVINDAYNANPESMAAALRSLAAIGAGRHRSWAVLGPMAELGAHGPEAHELTGRLAAELGITRVVAVGEQARPILAGAALEGSALSELNWVPDGEAALRLLRAETGPGDVVLVKASRSAGLEQVALGLISDPGGHGADHRPADQADHETPDVLEPTNSANEEVQ